MAGGQPRTAGRSPGGSGSSGRSRNELWSLLTEYLTPPRDCGVTLPSGPCKRIHAKDKRVQLIVERREYLQSIICSDNECETTTEEVFYKNPEKRVALLEDGKFSERRNPILAAKVQKSFLQLVDEFASTVKPGRGEDTENVPVLYETPCPSHCDELIHLLEFGKVEDLDRYPKEKYEKVMRCYHGSQAIGHHMSFFMRRIVHFFVGTKLLLYNSVEKAPKLDWMYESSCDGQTFLPYQRKNLHLWMKDLDATTRMCKVAFRCVYLYVYLRRKFEPNYTIETDDLLKLTTWSNDAICLRCFKTY